MDSDFVRRRAFLEQSGQIEYKYKCLAVLAKIIQTTQNLVV